MMSGWEWGFLILLVCLVSGATGWCTASARYLEVCHRVASMEAAVAAYWDRIRKRMMVEQRPAPKSVDQMTDAELMAIARRDGLLVDHVPKL
jgi:hypothetical protein